MASGGGSSLVPCVCWVPKGASKETPDKVELSQEELQELMKEAQERMGGLDVSQKKEGEGEMEGAEKSVEEEYNLDQYSSDENEEEGEKVCGAGMGNGLAGLAYFASNDSDPYITLKNPPPEENEEEDFKILSTENLLIVGRADDEFSSVEVHVFSDGDFHCYCHHEILLTSFPLALEWMDFDPGEPDKKGSYLVVGMMAPGIEIWDLDLVDGLEPILTLGPSTFDLTSTKSSKSKSKKKKKKKGDGESCASGDSGEDGGGHSDAVLGLAWNRIVRTALASASADKTVRIWDMCGPKCVLTLPHPDKVQCVEWHPYDPQLLATGGYDGRVRLFNCMASQSKTREWRLDGEVEKLLWNHLKPDHLLASTDGHTVHCLDRNTESTVFQIHAHTDAICDLSLSCYIPGLLVTASTDDTINFWDIQDEKPVFLLSRPMHMGAVLCARFCVDSPYALVVGGTKNGYQTIDIRGMDPVARRFRGRDMIMPLVPDSSTNGKKEGEVGTSDRDAMVENEAESEAAADSVSSHLEDEDDEEMEVDASSATEEKKVKGKKTKHKGKGRHKRKGRMH